MRLREVYRYELEYRLRRPLTWIFFVIQGLLTFWTNLATFDEPNVHFNSPARLAVGMALAGLAGILISAALFGDAAMRDSESEMDQLLFTSRLRKNEYLGGRFLGALTVNVIILLAIPLTQVIIALSGMLRPEDVGAFRVGAYLQPFLLFSLPNLMLFGAILFAVGALARQTIPVYLGAIGIFIAYLVFANATEGMQDPTVVTWGDPIGIGVLLRITRFWAPAESNTQLVGFPWTLVLNRVIWLAMTAAVLVVLHRRFRFAHNDVKGGNGKWKMENGITNGPILHSPLSIFAVAQGARTFTVRMRLRQTLSIARHSIEEIALSRVGLVTLLITVGLTFLWGWNVGDTMPFDTSSWPLTSLVAEEVLNRRNSPLIVLLIAVYAGELVWKDRNVGAAEMTDAAPVPVGAMLLGRFLALMIMLASMQAAFMVAGILIQTLQGYTNFEPGLYLKMLFGLSLFHWGLIAALAMVVHVIVNQKYLGHVVVILAFVFTMSASMFNVFHNLLIYAKDPGWTYSDMNGFGPFIGPFLAFKLYWAAWAFLLAVVANLLWVRGRETGLRHRVLEARARFGGGVARSAAVAVALILVLGGFVFYNTNVINEYRSPRDANDPGAEYEKRYKRFEHAPQPTITAVQLRAEIYPEEPAVDLRGTYRMVNKTTASIDSVHVTFIDPDIRANSISFDRASRPALVDDERHYRIYMLERPLAPGESLQLTFDLSLRPRGFKNERVQTKVVANGTNFGRSLLPAIGYQRAGELTDDEPRRRRGLAPRRVPGPDDAAARRIRWPILNEDLVDLDAVVGTAADQTVIMSPGVLRKNWTEKGRRYFHFQTEAPSLLGANVFSAKWAVRNDRWNDVALQIYHHPDHGYNLDRTIRSMKASLEYFTQEFGPYPYKELRMVEIPRYGGFGRAMATTISFSENYFQSRVKEGEVDMPFYGTAHEVAHTWWHGTVPAARVTGSGFLSESLANYSAMILTEKTFGREAGRKVYDFQMERYLLGRAQQSGEVALLDVEDQPYIAYRKGAIAMCALREYIGEDRVNGALRRFQQKYREAKPPYPTSRDLYAELRAVTPDSLYTVLEDLFETITVWTLRMERAVYDRTESGEYAVTIEFNVRKSRADSLGSLKDVPMDDLIEVGVFARGEGDELGAPLYLKQHRIRSGEHTLRIVVPREPSRAGIDPYRKLIDREVSDNVYEVRKNLQGGSR